jgi:uncharacterized membrane protein
MSTLGDVLKGIREAVVMDERIQQLSEKVSRMDTQLLDARERIVRLETAFSIVYGHSSPHQLPPDKSAD